MAKILSYNCDVVVALPENESYELIFNLTFCSEVEVLDPRIPLKNPFTTPPTPFENALMTAPLIALGKKLRTLVESDIALDPTFIPASTILLAAFAKKEGEVDIRSTVPEMSPVSVPLITMFCILFGIICHSNRKSLKGVLAKFASYAISNSAAY